jgi:hypothetical protein
MRDALTNTQDLTKQKVVVVMTTHPVVPGPTPRLTTATTT